MAYPIQTFVCVVDSWRRPSRQRNTKGRYLVGAKSERQACDFLRPLIGFGSVNCIGLKNAYEQKMRYGQCMKVNPDRTLSPVRHSCDPL